MSDNPSDNGPASQPGAEPPADNANGRQAFETLRQFLESDSWYPQPLEEKTIFRF